MTPRERFLRYVTYYTTSDDFSETAPSTERQKELIRELAREMEELGLKDISFDSNSNVYGTLPANVKGAPSIALIAHVDTAPDAPGENVRPAVITCPEGEFTLESGVVMNEALCPGISQHVGEELIVTDGTTLLGADDKAGVAEIMTAAQQLLAMGGRHATLKIGFTPDEEIGRGADRFDVKGFGADFAYTADGGPVGEIEYENFNAAGAKVVVHGLNIHPGSAKGKMVNSQLIAMEFQSLLPVGQRPELTEGYEGFFHLLGMKGEVERSELHYIIRDHDMEKFEEKKAVMTAAADFINRKYGAGTLELTLKDSYYNMKKCIEPCMYVVERAKKAMAAAGMNPVEVPIRGGTDGAVLSWKGLPCPNLGTGGFNFHGVCECTTVERMDKATEILLNIVELYSK